MLSHPTAALDQLFSAGPPAAPAVISARGLRKRYGAREAVRGIDLEVRRGEILAVLGPNGAGKTTTLEILSGFRAADAGTIRVLGADPWRAPAGCRSRIGIVLQESAPEAGLTVRECLSLYAGYYRRPRAVEETLALVELTGAGDALAATLSGGQRRRLDVALALIGNPELVFLDEPTTGFDPAARRAAWEMIAGLRALGTTIVLTTHQLEEAEFLADRIVVFAGGRVVAEGTPGSLGGRARAGATITLGGAAGIPAAFAARAAIAPDGRIEIAASDDLAADLRELGAWAYDAGASLQDLEIRRPTLEDVYLQLTADPTNPTDRSER